MLAHMMADAVTAGCRVYGLVTPVLSRMTVVAPIDLPRATKVSPNRFCVSPNVIPSQPSSSAFWDAGPARRGNGRRLVHSSGALACGVIRRNLARGSAEHEATRPAPV